MGEFYTMWNIIKIMWNIHKLYKYSINLYKAVKKILTHGHIHYHIGSSNASPETMSIKTRWDTVYNKTQKRKTATTFKM